MLMIIAFLIFLLAVLAFGLLCVPQLPESAFHDHTFDVGSLRFGFSLHLIGIGSDIYMERWILWAGIGTLRLHKFHRGDDARAPHDHPFWFVTFPFTSYWELVSTPDEPTMVYNYVKAFRFHYRPAKYRHIVKLINDNPIWTFVFTGRKTNEWGFWRYNGLTCQREFVHWRDWR